ncbi:MAG TPA: TasA family protein [Candidatus Limnocylindrales bacterium]|nr:TasA family protein [Candidatus Limnocylindrales bacterium]
MKKNILYSMLVIVVVLALSLGATMAWFTAETDEIVNTFTAGTVLISADETSVTPAEFVYNVNPGDCFEKVFTITNDGTKRMVIRTEAAALITGGWYDEDGDPWAHPVPDEPFVVTITVDAPGWEQDGDYWYYTASTPTHGAGVILPGDDVTIMIRVCFAGEEMDNEYQGKVFKMETVFEAVQASNFAPYHQWETDVFGTPPVTP